jgi:hypothetical protein
MSSAMEPSPEVPGPDSTLVDTYRHLRLMLIMLPLLMLVAMLVLAARGSIEDSISAYYLGPIRDIFVGAMVGTAVCLIVYRGRPAFEDYTLNVAGFYAFFVAFVPTGVAETLAGLGPAEREEAVFALRTSIASVLVIAVVFVVVERLVGVWTPAVLLRRTGTRWPFLATNVLGALFLLAVAWRAFLEDDFRGIHLAAALLLVASLAMAVATHAWPGPFGGDGPGQGRYRVIVVLMALGVPVFLADLVLPWWTFGYTVVAVEWWELGLFLVYWVMEARRTWSRPGSTGVAPGIARAPHDDVRPATG